MFRNNLWNAASMNKNYQHKTSFSEMFSPLSSSSLFGSPFDQVFQLDGSMLTAEVNDNSNNSSFLVALKYDKRLDNTFAK